MAINIFSSKAFAIGPGAQRGSAEIDSFITVPGAFQSMPDKYANDPTFLLAVKAGDIKVMDGTKVAEKAVEHAVENPVVDHAAKMDSTQAFYEELKVMNREDTLILGEKYGLTIENNEKMGAFKKRIMEAYKLDNEG